MNVFFSPKGRIGPVTFRNNAMILVAIGVALNLVPLVWPSPLLAIIGLIFLYPWAMLWIKRLHDAGKSGWLFLGVLVLQTGIGIAVQFLVIRPMGPPQAPVNPGDMAAAMASAAAQMQATAIPNAIASLIIVLAVVLIGNALLKSEPGPNAYGPPAAP